MEELEEINKKIQEIKAELGQEFIPIQNLEDAKRVFTQLKTEASAINSSLSFVAQSFRDSVAELSNQNTELGFTRNALRSISNVSNQILATRSLEGQIGDQELAKLEKRADLQFRSLQIAIDSGRLQGEALEEAQDAVNRQEEFFRATKQIREEQEEINRNSGVRVFSGLEDITQSIPGLRKFSGAFKEAATAARQQANFNKSAKNDLSGSVTKISALRAGFRSLGPVLARSLGPLALLSQLASVFLEIDKIAGNLAKSLGTSYKNSTLLLGSFNKIQATSDSIFVTTKNLAESFVAINESLGTNAELDADLLITQTELVKQAGYSVEAATQLSQLSLATGKSSEDITVEFLGQVRALNQQNDLAITEKKLLDDIGKISKATLATFADQTNELASAAFEARKLGLDLTQLEKIQSSLLDIERSLSAEFEAEVILSRQFNLERARAAALNNDLLTVAKELNAQQITLEYFGNINFLQQEAIAAQFGLQRDEMGQMLLESEAILKLSDQVGESLQERFNNLVATEGIEAARARLGKSILTDQLASASVQERFTQSVEKLKEVFVDIATIVGPLFSTIADLVSFTASLIGKVEGAGNILGGAALGASIGSVIPGVGTAIGGTIGTILGAAQYAVGDLEYSAGDTRPRVSLVEGGLLKTYVGTNNDDVKMAPGIASERNRGLSSSDIKAIASAVQEGASKANLFFDARKVNSTLQVPFVQDGRKYSY